MISHECWDVIRSTARNAIGAHLRDLGLTGQQVSKRYIKAHHTKEWMRAVGYLEKAQPLIGLCAGHWKAEHVLSSVLSNERTSSKRAKKRAVKRVVDPKTQPSSEEGEDFGDNLFNGGNDNDTDDDVNDNDNGSSNTDLKGKKRAAPHSKEDPPKSKKTKVNREAKPAPKTKPRTKPPATENESQEPTAQSKKKVQKSTVPAASLESQINGGDNRAPEGDAGTAGALGSPVIKINIGFIRVRSDFTTLRGEFSRQQPAIPQATTLIDAMEASPNFQSSKPSDDVISLLNRIDAADPNSSEIGEDDSNESWGHWQFTAGGLTITTAVKDWASVGDVKTACQLLAAAIRTSKVARHICLERGIIPTGGYLSDIYLSNIVERLYDCWTAAGGKITEKGSKSTSKTSKSSPLNAAPLLSDAAAHDKGSSLPSLPPPIPDDGPSNTTQNSESSAAAPDTSVEENIYNLMKQHLQVADLKAWIETYHETTNIKHKKNLVEFIIQSDTVPTPSADEIQGMVSARKAKSAKTV